MGRGLATHFIKCAKANRLIKARRASGGQNFAYVKPCATIFNLGAKKKSNDTNTWWIPTLEKKDIKLNDKYLGTCAAWLKTLRDGNHQVDNSEFNETHEEPASDANAAVEGREDF